MEDKEVEEHHESHLDDLLRSSKAIKDERTTDLEALGIIPSAKVESPHTPTMSDLPSAQLVPKEQNSPNRTICPQKDIKTAPLVDVALQVPLKLINAQIIHLEGLRKEKAEEAYRLMTSGRSHEEPARTIAELNSKIEALNQLRLERVEYERISAKLCVLKEKMMSLLAQGLSSHITPVEVEENKQADKHLEGLRRRISDLASIADLSGISMEAISEYNNQLSTPTSNILVESTQISRDRISNPPMSSFDGENSISQTPVPPRTKPYIQTSQSATNLKTFALSSVRPLAELSEHESGMFVDENDFDDVGSEVFTRNMGGSSHVDPFADEEFDYGADDDEMAQFAADFEESHHRRFDTNPPPRPMLSETSVNIVRKPSPAKKRSSQVDHVSLAATPQFPWSKDVKNAMKHRFHMKGFRHNQLEAINATLAGKDVFVLMPTGGGKSLCYQLPSIVTTGRTKGVTVVISPLLSLMNDQVAHLQKLEIQAFVLNGDSNIDERRFLLDALKKRDPERFIQILYITPEMIRMSTGLSEALDALHRNECLARLVIDEAHCVSQWGHDFRPDYTAIGEVRKRFRGVPAIALTATATENVKIDVMHNLGMSGCEVLVQSFNRPNLTYEVRRKDKDVLSNIADLIKTKYNKKSGIIYCLARKSCEQVARKLSEVHGVLAQHYHAGMASEERAEVQTKWQNGRYNVIVATIAFGMGIDKPDVRFVIHHSMPKSLEGYYQETGRAGRDGLRSGCYLFYSPGDMMTLKSMITSPPKNKQEEKQKQKLTPEQEERQLQLLRNVTQFCENKMDCRRVQVLAYFGETFYREDCRNTCDNCLSEIVFEERDFAKEAALAVRLVGRLDRTHNYTVIHCVDILLGRRVAKISKEGHDKLKEYGSVAHMDRVDLERLFYVLINEEALREERVVGNAGFSTQYVKSGPKQGLYLHMTRPVVMQVREQGESVSQATRRLASRKQMKSGNASSDYPPSTNVSSPVQPSHSKQRRPPATSRKRIEEYSDEEGFGPVRVGTSRISSPSRRPSGRPITQDRQLGQLDEFHRDIVNDFLQHAKEKTRKVSLSHDCSSIFFC